ncbi:hypothetical protein ACL6C3_14745 [Capilliphycus salinus ALCB114379]|uniref:hypothetical protein n=1 Tax=Capilliphycus salinus TaxID=2768948 RepID=UPI0039A6FC00
MRQQNCQTNLQSDDGLVGYWQSSQGSLQINEDGTLHYAGQTYLYMTQNNILIIVPSANTYPSSYPYSILYQRSGDTLRLMINGQELTFVRQSQTNQNRTELNYNPITNAIAGVWVGEESCLDPSYYMRYTRYLILYPDSSVGFDKTEGGGSWTKVRECLQRFSYFSSHPMQNQDIWGEWQADGINILIYWRNNPVWQGQVDLNSGRMVMFGVGVIEEGTNVLFERKM